MHGIFDAYFLGSNRGGGVVVGSDESLWVGVHVRGVFKAFDLTRSYIYDKKLQQSVAMMSACGIVGLMLKLTLILSRVSGFYFQVIPTIFL